MNARVLSMCVTATAAAMAKSTNSAAARDALPGRHIAQRLERVGRIAALDLNLHRPGSEVVAAEQPTQPDQVLYPLPLGQKANAGGLQCELGRRDEHRIAGRENGDEVEGRVDHYRGYGDLPLRPHAGLFPLLRQHPLYEVEALLRLGELTLQLADFELERFELSLHPVQRFGPGSKRPQALGPEPESDGEGDVPRGMRGFRSRGREPGRDRVDTAQHDGDGVPGRGLEGHGSPTSPASDACQWRAWRACGHRLRRP